jgi:hypothetical protein
VTILLRASFPIFTVVWIIIPLVVVIRTRDANRVGIHSIPWNNFMRITVLNLMGVFVVRLLFEPWSHTYQKLLDAVL